MYSIIVNGNKVYKADLSIKGSQFKGQFADKSVEGDLIKISEFQYHLLYKGRSFNIDVIKANKEEKSITLKVNSEKYTIQLKDKYDELLHSLGLDNLVGKKINDLKAPMPGMVLNILVKVGDHVIKGDALIVLEAMKMENIIKSPTDGTIKQIAAVKGTAVEKNQLLIEF